MKEGYLKISMITLIIGILLIIFAPYFLTSILMNGPFDQTGQIGDTIGGIASPIASLLGSILVFFALKAQIDANKMVFIQFEYQKQVEVFSRLNAFILDQITLIRRDISEFSVIITTTTTSGPTKENKIHTVDHKGVEGIAEALKIYSKMNKDHYSDEADFANGHLIQIQKILERILFLLLKIEHSKLPKEDQQNFFSTILYTYESKLLPFLTMYEKERDSKKEPCPKCGKIHQGLPESLYSVFDEINNFINKAGVN